MNIKKFRFISKFTGNALKALALMGIISIILGLFLIFFTPSNASFSIDMTSRGFTLFSAGFLPVAQSDENLTALILAPLFISVLSYLTWKGGILFERLSNEETPFSYHFAHSVKHISLMLIIMDSLIPLLYSLILTIIMKNGYYFTFSLSSMFLIGLILYAVAEILSYGIGLQKLSDEIQYKEESKWQSS